MNVIKYFIFGFIAVMSLAQIVAPQLLWRASRWQYRNPAANEPSRAGFMVQRVVGGIVFVFIVVVFIVQSNGGK